MPSLGYRRSPAARGSETSSRRPSFQIRDPLSAHGKVRATAVLPPTVGSCTPRLACPPTRCAKTARFFCRGRNERSEEHTSELQSRLHLVCRLLLEKKKRYSIAVAGHADTRD